MDPKVKSMVGLTFGRLTVTAHVGRRGISRNHFWRAACECGAEVEVNGAALRRGDTRSCGCLQREIAAAAGDRTRTHGMSKTSTYAVWDSMIQRCENPNRKDFKRYGGSGITVCERWHQFDNFLADMGARPEGMTIDRKNNALGYSPENCRWATPTEQARNQSSNRLLSFNGITRCMSEWAEALEINPQTLIARFGRGWSVAKALSTPVDARFSRSLTCCESRRIDCRQGRDCPLRKAQK